MIEVKKLVKVYGTHRALDDVSFTVNEGEILGFLGPNGAGKSTTMNIITGFLSATRGTVTVDGFDILDEPLKAKSRLGYMPELPPLYEDMLVNEYLQFVADIKKVKKTEKTEMIADICRKLQITEVSDRLIKNLSKGYKQRVGLAQAMIGNPAVLILDEPTVGLDPSQIIEMRNVIKDLGKQHTIILSSHILSEISAVCDRVMIINKGKVVASDTMDNLSKNLNKGNKLLIRIRGSEDEVVSTLNKIDGIENFNYYIAADDDAAVDVDVSGIEDRDIREALFYAFADRRLPILMMKSNELSLEEIFIKITADESIETLKSIDTIESADADLLHSEYEAADNSADEEETANDKEEEI